MKLTKAWFECVLISWNCWECGLRNRTSLTRFVSHPESPIVSCSRCKSKRKAKINLYEPDLLQQAAIIGDYPSDDIEQIKKLSAKSLIYAKRYKKAKDKQLKEQSHQKKRKKK